MARRRRTTSRNARSSQQRAVPLRGQPGRGGRGRRGKRTSPWAWFSSLRRGAKWLVGAVVAAGGVAAAIGSILALWPAPTPELRGDISDVSIDTNVPLSEYRTRHEISAVAPMTNTLHLVAGNPAQTTTGETETGETETGETGETETGETETGETETGETETGETETGETETGETETGETETGETETGETTTTERGAVKLSRAARARVLEGVSRALEDPLVPQMGVLPACLGGVDPNCSGFVGEHVYLGVFNEDGSISEVIPDDFASRLAKLLAGTRMNPASSGGGEVEPVGVTVNYNVSLTGFRGHRVSVRWSLYRAAAGVQVPRDWLRNQPVRWLEGEADKDSASDSFWVPLPEIEGPFFVRVGVFDQDDVRLDYADTSSFR
jgi:hypothetical protein